MSEANALIAEVRISLSRPARAFVEYDNPLAGRYQTAFEAPAAEHTIPIVRLRPETTYDYTVFTLHGSDGSNAVRGPSGSFTTGELPAPLAPIFTVVAGRSSQPLILTDRWISPDSIYFLFWDEVGALVWYMHMEGRGGRAVARPPGQENFLFVEFLGRLRQFTPLGDVIDLLGDFDRIHHDLVVLDNGRVLLPVSRVLRHDDSADGGFRTEFVYDRLEVWDPTGRIEQVWSANEAWDMLDPAQHWGSKIIVEDGRTGWTNLNSASFGPHGNLVLSLRKRNQVVSLSPDYKVEWQLFGPGSDYEFPNPADRFYRQHTASQLANGNILLFDNGNGRPDAEGGEYSRALELRLDDAAGTAVKVWEYRSDPDIYAPHRGSAYRLNNGNTLVNFDTNPTARATRPGGWANTRSAYPPIVIVEVDASGDEVFRLETVNPDVLPRQYRANVGFEAIRGETMLRPPLTRDEGYERMAPVATGRFNLYLGDGSLVYAKEPCEAEDIALRFFLHVHPWKLEDLPTDRRDAGFDNLDFKLLDRGVLWRGKCHAELRLPEYAINYIRTGQFVAEDEAAGDHDLPNGSPAHTPWTVEIPLNP